MYQHRTIHVIDDEKSDLALMDQLVRYADIMDSEVSLLGKIGLRAFEYADPEESEVSSAENHAEKVLKYLHKHDVKIGSHQLTVQGLVHACDLFARTQGADCISLNLNGNGGKLQGAKKGIAYRSEQNVLLLREAGKVPPTTIICPVDASPASSKGLRQAQMLAFACDAELRIVSVLGTPRLYASPSFGMPSPVSYPQIEEHIAQERRVMKAFISRHMDDGSAAEVEYIHQGVASDVIIDFAKKHPDALLILGVAARDRFTSAILGNTAFKVAKNAVNTTLLVRNNDY